MIDIPKLMRVLPKDKRGYPIPYVVLIDKSGKPQFTINDQRKVDQCRGKKLCSICGRRLAKTFYFVGGPRSAFDPNGAYIDGPMHDECSAFALQVCPYLAAPNYNKRIDLRLMDPKNKPDEVETFLDPAMIPERPVEFIRGETDGYRLVGVAPTVYHKPNAWIKTEAWVGGKLK